MWHKAIEDVAGQWGDNPPQAFINTGVLMQDHNQEYYSFEK